MKGATTRGYEFEAEIAKLLRASGFDVTPNAKTAKPRQTDLFAVDDEMSLLIEAKNRKHKIDVSDIDSLRSRLIRTSSDIVGVIFATSGLTRGAIEAIEADRRREVLAFTGDEVEHLYSGAQNLKSLIQKKRNELRIQGKAWFSSGVHSEFVGVKLPPCGIEFRVGGKTGSNFESRSDFGGIFYSLRIPDSGWGGLGGEGARLSVQLNLNTIKDLRNIIGYLHKKFGLSGNGAFSIQQSESCWHGAGLENLLNALENWRARYEQSQSELFHHSEEFNYFEEFRNGWLELSAQQRVDWEESNDTSFLHHSQLAIQLQGVPVDVSPFLKLCQYTGNDWANFEFVGQRWTLTRRLKKPLPLRVIGTIVNRELVRGSPNEEQIVVGVIARNPFYQKTPLPSELQNAELPLHGLDQTELLMCSLRDWHEVGYKINSYKLQGFETTLSAAGLIIRPFGSWKKTIKRS